MSLKQLCEVYIMSPDGSERYCQKLARIKVNGFPCCAKHFSDFEEDDVIDSVGQLEESYPGPGPSHPPCLVTAANNSAYYCSRYAGHTGPCAAWPVNGQFP